MAAKKPNDKLSKLDKRIAAVAPGKKYSDFTPAEKRKYDTNTARYVAELEKQKKGSAKKSSKETVKAATAKGSGKPKYKNVDEAQRKNVNQGKTIFKESPRTATKKNAPIVKEIKREATKSRTEKPSTKKVPVKPRGGAGMRGGLGSFGSGSGMRGSVNK
jgi:hypothetical protein